MIPLLHVMYNWVWFSVTYWTDETEAATLWITVRLWLFTIYSHFQTRCRPTYLYIGGLCVYTTAGIWTVKYNTQNAPENGAISWCKIKKKIWGYAPSPNLSPGGEGDTPSPSAPRLSRLQRDRLCSPNLKTLPRPLSTESSIGATSSAYSTSLLTVYL